MVERSLRVLIITNHYPPDINPSGKLMHQLAVGLRELGHTVDILTSFPHYQSFRIQSGHRRRFMETEHVSQGRVTRLWVFASGQKQRMLHRLANYMSFNVLATLTSTFSSRKYDVVLANSGSFFTGITSWFVRVLRGTPFIYNVQDIYPDVPVRAGQLKSGVAIRGLEQIERFMYARAQHISVVSQQQSAVLQRKGVPPGKITVIPNFVDTSFIRPYPKDNAVSRRLGLHDKFVIAHAGNLGFVYDFESMLAAAAALRHDAAVLFLIIGDGVRKEELKHRIAELGLTNVQMLPFQPESDLPALRGAVDVQLSLYVRNAVEASLPSKIYEIMASGRPAIVAAERSSDLCKLIELTGCGICIEPENSAGVAQAIRRLRTDAGYAALLGQRGRDAAVRKFSKEAAVEAYAELLARVAQH